MNSLIKKSSFQILILIFTVFSCEDEDVFISDNDITNPIKIDMEFSNRDCPYNIAYNDICEKTIDTYTSVLISEQINESKYTVTAGWSLFQEDCFSGYIGLVFIGELSNQISTPCSMKKLIQNSIEQDSQNDQKVNVEINLRINRENYSSIIVDRLNGSFGYSDPNKTENLSYAIEDTPINCLNGVELLAFNYSFTGYLFNDELSDSIFIDQSSFEIHTIVF